MNVRPLWAGWLGTLVLAATVAASPGNSGPAERLVGEAVKRARAEGKAVLVEFTASWCSYCKDFDAFVHAAEIADIIAGNYVVVKVVVQEPPSKESLENPGGEELMKSWGGADAGLPFLVFVDALGKKVADSNVMPDGDNIGFPATPEEIELFLGLIDRTAPRVSAPDRRRLMQYLTRAATARPGT